MPLESQSSFQSGDGPRAEENCSELDDALWRLLRRKIRLNIINFLARVSLRKVINQFGAFWQGFSFANCTSFFISVK
jgi:hypothetical protein